MNRTTKAATYIPYHTLSTLSGLA